MWETGRGRDNFEAGDRSARSRSSLGLLNHRLPGASLLKRLQMLYDRMKGEGGKGFEGRIPGATFGKPKKKDKQWGEHRSSSI